MEKPWKSVPVALFIFKRLSKPVRRRQARQGGKELGLTLRSELSPEGVKTKKNYEKDASKKASIMPGLWGLKGGKKRD